MKKIGILTACRTNNIGTDLQTYAMQESFKHFSDVEIINYTCEKLEKSNQILPAITIKNIYKIPYKIFKKYVHSVFRRKYIKYSKNACDKYNIKKVINEYNVIVVGSDQIWNLNITGEDLNFFLPIDNPKIEKFAYAPSFGVENLEEWENKYNISKFLKKFNEVTVREKSGVYALEKIGINANEMLDPILMLSSDLWQKFNKKTVNRPYMLIYQVCTNIRESSEAIKYAKNNGWKIIRISEPSRMYTGICAKNFVSMEGWMNYIQNAELIITDSYHGLSFSIANHKNVRLISLYNQEQNIRSFCLLKKLNLFNIIYSNNKFDEEPDWLEVEERLKKYREKANEYIERICR